MQFGLKLILIGVIIGHDYWVTAYNTNVGNIANKFFLEKEKFLLEILQRVQEPPLNEEFIVKGMSLASNQQDYLNFNSHMKKFLRRYQEGNLLAKTIHFSPLNEEHFEEALGLFYIFYNSIDWRTLRQNIYWARVNTNPGMFIFVLMQTFWKKQDYHGLVLPKIYEILPEHFFPEQFVRQMEKFDFASWSKQQIDSNFNLKEEESYTNSYDSGPIIFSTFETTPLPYKLNDLRNTSSWVKAMADLKFIWAIPKKLKQSTSLLSSMNHLTKDVSWNAYWYYMNMGLLYADIEEDIPSETLSEYWLWTLQQIVSRYEIETKSLQNFDRKQKSHQQDSSSSIISWTGQKFKAADAHYYKSIKKFLKHLTKSVDQALFKESFTFDNGTWLNLSENNNWKRVQNYLFSLSHFKSIPSLKSSKLPYHLFSFETMMLDSEFFENAQMALKAYRKLKSHFASYQKHHLEAPGVAFRNVDVTQLLTYYELVDVDVSNLLNNKHFFYEGIFFWHKSLQARVPRLQHIPFQITLNISSDRVQAVVVRTFLSRDCLSNEHCEYFQLDTFVTSLAAGHNIVQRQSREFFGTVRDHIGYSEIFQYNLLSLNDEFAFPFNITTDDCGFPNRLVLPQGHEDGLEMKLIFIVTPYAFNLHVGRNNVCDFSRGVTRFDELPFGFPFDRDFEPALFYKMKNVYFKNIKIYQNKNFK